MESFYRFNGRLALFRPAGVGKDQWEARWGATDLGRMLQTYRSGKLDEFERIFLQYLPKDLPVLEAGCGCGQLVMALSTRGYAVEGVDYAHATIRRIQEAAPELNVRTGDIYHLDAPDKTYGGYISIGLFEHDANGPQAALKEACRVLHPRGVALISVPDLNAKRKRLLRRAGTLRDSKAPGGLNFYQYYFSQGEFEKHLEAAGFKILECFPYGVHTGLVRGSAFWQRLGHSRFFIWPLQHRFIRWCATAPRWVRFKAAHMLMFACQSTGGV